jgi:hypothetical protein
MLSQCRLYLHSLRFNTRHHPAASASPMRSNDIEEPEDGAAPLIPRSSSACPVFSKCACCRSPNARSPMLVVAAATIAFVAGCIAWGIASPSLYPPSCLPYGFVDASVEARNAAPPLLHDRSPLTFARCPASCSTFDTTPTTTSWVVACRATTRPCVSSPQLQLVRWLSSPRTQAKWGRTPSSQPRLPNILLTRLQVRAQGVRLLPAQAGRG